MIPGFPFTVRIIRIDTEPFINIGSTPSKCRLRATPLGRIWEKGATCGMKGA